MSLYVQSANSTAAAASTLSVAYPSNVGTGKRLLLLGILDYRAGTGAVRTVSDTFSSSWNRDVLTTLLATIDFTIYSAIAPAAGGANTVQVSYGGVNQTSIILAVHEYRLMRTVTPFDQGVGAVDSSGTSAALNSGNVTTLFDNELIFGWGAGHAGTLTAGSNEAFALRESTAAGFATMDAIKGAKGVTSAQFTDTAAGDWLCAVATYRRRIEANASLDGTVGGGCVAFNQDGDLC